MDKPSKTRGIITFIIAIIAVIVMAIILEKVARNSVKVAADSRCMYCLHQPKQPKGIEKFRK